MPADLTAIRAIHARIPPPGNLPGGWMRAYQQDVGTLLARVDELEAEAWAAEARNDPEMANMLAAIAKGGAS